MTSSELIKLKKNYLIFKENLEFIIDENSRAIEKITGADILLDEGYSLGDYPIDGGYLKKSIGTVSETHNAFKRVLANVNAKISSLTREIEIAEDKELAERIAAAGGTDGNKM